MVRKVKKEKIALILTGGSATATFEVGVLKELFKKVNPDFFIAASAGSATLGGILANLDGSFKNSLAMGAEGAEKVWKSLAAKKKISNYGREWGIDGNIFALNLRIFLGPMFADSLFKINNYESFIKDLVGDRKIEDLSKPMYIAAIDIGSGKTVFFDKGKLAPAIIASCSAVPFYPPYKIGDKTYIDGSLDIGACIKKAAELGADKIILVNKKNEKELGKNVFSIIHRTVDVLLSQHTNYYINNGFKDKILQITSAEKISSDFNDFSSIDKVIKLGEKAAINFLKENKFSSV